MKAAIQIIKFEKYLSQQLANLESKTSLHGEFELLQQNDLICWNVIKKVVWSPAHEVFLHRQTSTHFHR